MANHPYMTIKQVFMDAIGFLNYVELDADSLNELGVADLGVTRAFISPDVHSLDIVWENADGSWQGEIADYPYDEENLTLTDFLSSEIGDNSWQAWDVGEITDVHEDILSDFGKGQTAENTKTISLKALQDAENAERQSDRHKTAKLFRAIGIDV